MALYTLARPCWTYTCAADHHDQTGYRTHALHRNWVRLPADCDRPYELPSPCVTAFCDSCGADFHHPVDPSRGVWHFPTVERAVEELLTAGWTSAGNTWHCPDCPAFLALTPNADTALHHAA